MSDVTREKSKCCSDCEIIDTVRYCGSCGRIDVHPLLKSKCRPRQKGIVDKETLKLEARLSQLIEIICLPIKPTDHSNYCGQAKTISVKLDYSTMDLDNALQEQRKIESC